MVSDLHEFKCINIRIELGTKKHVYLLKSNKRGEKETPVIFLNKWVFILEARVPGDKASMKNPHICLTFIKTTT